MKLDLREIPDIGATFAKDFARIGITAQAQLVEKNPVKGDRDNKT